ncbi:FAD-binding oxidoreductase [Nonomuraea sp. NEAU-A123]|uniref:NAD(P)/FAD-dependent oxidoreductase n=1 Tax=Nonomuraea sp. NEAU-A123 TaxID=2839649 RepID=UPI001BE4ADD0|nr:FAD-dependent oxidoreductase [Nonomuraea sp. NEAU-A123]MBT2230078.1 FAD-binding oxidoreductase [Nonomuraea sp. NEAU-A123]MBT2230652.1 FAD-binding oxidoreductase [Nonomuraea sp. NEAU-A123]
MRDFLVVGGGMAGASAGYFLAESGSVTLLEMEHAPGYHATGRSAALFSEYFGNQAVRALTTASRPFLTTPPPGFADGPLLTPRGVLTLCPAGAVDAAERFAEMLADGLSAPTPVRELDPDEVRRHCPIVRSGWYSRALLKPAAMDIDVDALHQGFLRGIRARGGQVITSARVRSLSRRGGLWRAATDAAEFAAPILVNAAGAWADEVAVLAGVRPVGLRPLRRTAFLVDLPGGLDATRWPMVTDVADTFYFKPESGRLLISPADATPMPPGDVRPEDLDVAIAVERLHKATTLEIRSVRHAWAGLRSAVADETPVVGEAPDAPGFVWLAALSGYGVQTAPAVGRIAAAAARRTPPDVAYAHLSPERPLLDQRTWNGMERL